MTDQKQTAELLYGEVCKSLGDSVVRAMAVAEQRYNGMPARITQQQLAKKSRVSRSTIAKYIAAAERNDIGINPDLETLCRLANALHVPPALLLMRKEDWARLAQAGLTMIQALQDEKINAIVNDSSYSKQGSALMHAMAGLKIAERMGLCQNQSVNQSENDDGSGETSRLKNGIRQGISAAVALPPLNKLDAQYFLPLLSLCASIGATTNLT